MSRIRVAHISDSHWDARGDIEDLQRVHQAFIEQAVETGADVVVHAGDWFDRESEPDERLWLADWLQRASERLKIFGVRGNHDAARDLAVFNKLAAVNPVDIFDRPTVHHSIPLGVCVLALPWFDKSHIAAAAPVGAARGAVRMATIEQAQHLLTSYSAASDVAHKAGHPVILVGHVQVQGLELANGQVLMGQTVEVTPADLRLSGADYIAVGHIHKHQAWEAAGAAPVVYSGSPSRHDHGEPEGKGWVLVEFDGPRLVSWEFQPLPARELYHVDIDATQPDQLQALRDRNALRFLKEAQARGARVRIRYKVATEDLALVDDAMLRAAAVDLGAFDVKVERQAVATNVARTVAVEVSQQQGLAEKVQAYLRHKGIEERWERVAPRLAELEAGE